MSVLIIDESTKTRAAEVLQWADKHPFTIDDLLDMVNGQSPIAGQRPPHIMEIPIGYRAVFSIEQQRGHLIKHLSVSVNRPGKLPNEAAIRQIMELFQMAKLEDCDIRIEGQPGELQSVNVWSLI